MMTGWKRLSFVLSIVLLLQTAVFPLMGVDVDNFAFAESEESIIESNVENGEMFEISTECTSTTIQVTWQPIEGAEGYEIEIDGSIFDNGESIVYLHENLLPGTSHSYRVRTTGADGVSEWSELISATTPTELGSGVGLRGDYFINNDLTSLHHTRLDGIVDFFWNHDAPAPGVDGDEFGVRWTGQVEARYSEEYTFYTRTHGGVRLWVNNQLVIDDWDAHNTTHQRATVSLEKGERYDIQMEYRESNGMARAHLFWSSQSQREEVIPKSQLYPVGVPKNINTTSTEKSILVEWGEVTFATSYDFEVDGEFIENAGLSYLHEELIPGTLHQYRVRANNGEFAGEWSPVILATTLLATPTINMDSVEADETTISFSWGRIEGAHEYELEIDGVVVGNGDKTTFVHEALQPGTLHTYRVRAKSPDVTGEWSDLLEKWTLPDKAKNIEATATSNTITLLWDVVVGATGYEVEVLGTPVDIGNINTFTDDSVNPNMQRTYRVRAYNDSGYGRWSNIIAKTTLPATSEGFNGVATDTSIELAWDAVSGAIAYELEIDGSTSISLLDTKYIHSNLSPNSTHSYRVRTKSNEGYSEWSEAIKITTLPSTPTNVVTNPTANGIEITWSPVEGATGYDIEVDGLIIKNGESTSYTHEGLEASSHHTYRVRAKNGDLYSAWTPVISSSTLAEIPSNFRATATSTQIRLNWDVVIGATGYEIEVDGVIKSTGLNTIYLHEGLIPNTAHRYRVRARNASGVGVWSDYVETSTVFGTPANIRGTATSNSITLSWTPVAGATGYDVLVDGEIFEVGSDTFYEHTGLEPFTWHIYRVRAKSGGFIGEWSEGVTVATLLGTPANLDGEAQSEEITITWDPVFGAKVYEIEIDGMMAEVSIENSFNHTELKPNEEHTYRVRAKYDTVKSEWSEAFTISTAPPKPENFKAEPATHEMQLTWDPVENAITYDLEMDGEIITGLKNNLHIHKNLLPNTLHAYRVRVVSKNGTSSWTDLLEVNTTPELVIDIEKDRMFNFVIVAPPKMGATSRKITVTYNPEEVEVLDIYAATPEINLEVGPIAGTNVTIQSVTAGEIILVVDGADKTMVNIIKFMTKTSDYSKITYTIE